MTSRSWKSLLRALMTLALVGCISSANNQEAQTIWSHHRSTLNHPDLGPDYENSIQFFERLTGIQSNSWSWLGALPGPEPPETIQLWDAWYRAHASRLYVDAKDDKVKCRCRVARVVPQSFLTPGDPSDCSYWRSKVDSSARLLGDAWEMPDQKHLLFAIGCLLDMENSKSGSKISGPTSVYVSSGSVQPTPAPIGALYYIGYI